MTLAATIYAKRAARRAGVSEAAATVQPISFSPIDQAPVSAIAKPGKATLPDASEVYARRKAQRAARPAGSGESEE